jgi:hypothetical protein
MADGTTANCLTELFMGSLATKGGSTTTPLPLSSFSSRQMVSQPFKENGCYSSNKEELCTFCNWCALPCTQNYFGC